MTVARNRQITEQWIRPPEPALNRYLLRSRRRAANDNRGSFFKDLPVLQIATCLFLSGAITCIVASIT